MPMGFDGLSGQEKESGHIYLRSLSMVGIKDLDRLLSGGLEEAGKGSEQKKSRDQCRVRCASLEIR